MVRTRAQRRRAEDVSESDSEVPGPPPPRERRRRMPRSSSPMVGVDIENAPFGTPNETMSSVRGEYSAAADSESEMTELSQARRYRRTIRERMPDVQDVNPNAHESLVVVSSVDSRRERHREAGDPQRQHGQNRWRQPTREAGMNSPSSDGSTSPPPRPRVRRTGRPAGQEREPFQRQPGHTTQEREPFQRQPEHTTHEERRRRPRLRIDSSEDESHIQISAPKFREGNNWDVFLMKFEDYIQTAGVRTRRYDLILLQCLQDDKYYRKIKRLQFNQEEMEDARNLVKFVRNATTSVSTNAEQYRLKLKNMIQEEWENVEDFADRIRDVAETAFPDKPPSYVENRKLEALQDGVTDPTIAELVCSLRGRAIDFESIAIYACKKEITRKAVLNRRNTEDQVFNIAPSPPGPAQATAAPQLDRGPGPCTYCGRAGHSAAQCYTMAQCQLCSNVGHTAMYCRRWTGRYSQTSSQGRGQHTGESDQRRRDRENQACYECHQRGHRARECPTPNLDQGSGNVRAVGNNLSDPSDR